MADNEKDVPIKEQEDGSILAKIEFPDQVDEPVNEEEKEPKKQQEENDHDDDDDSDNEAGDEESASD